MSTLRVGYELIYECPQPTPMILMLNIHRTRVADIIVPDLLTTTPATPIAVYDDAFGNRCSRIVAPIGEIRISADGVVRDTGVPDIVAAGHSSSPYRICRKRFWYFSWAAGIAKLIGFLKWPGISSVNPQPGGAGFRLSVISSIAMLPSATSTPTARNPRGRCSTKARAFAATTHILRSPSADA